jgi:hypothetical protein
MPTSLETCRFVGDESTSERQFHELKTALHQQLIGSMDFNVLRTVDPKLLREELRRGAEQLCGTNVGLFS